MFGMRAAHAQGFSSTILTVLLIGGVQLVSIGIYHEIKARPTFVIRDRIAAPDTNIRPVIATEEPEHRSPRMRA